MTLVDNIGPIHDLTNCDREPIQWPGFIQSHGYLLALDPITFTVWQASENCNELTNLPIDGIIGRCVADLQFGDLPGATIHELLKVESGPCQYSRVFHAASSSNQRSTLVGAAASARRCPDCGTGASRRVGGKSFASLRRHSPTL